MSAASIPLENGTTTTTSTTTTTASPPSSLPLTTAAAAAEEAIENPTALPPTETTPPETEKWPGWPGHCVFRLIVPVSKVGSIIGRKGDLIKKLCEETRARVRVLDAAGSTPQRVVLISGKEELDAPLSPAMDAATRIFKCVNGLSESGAEGESAGAAGSAYCTIKLLVAPVQAMTLIGKQGSLIKSIQESTGASMRVLPGDDKLSSAAADEKIVEVHGEALKVAKAFEAVVGHLRKFLVDQTVIPLFEKTNSTVSQDRQAEAWHDKQSILSSSQIGSVSEYPFSLRREHSFLDRETQLESRLAPPPLPSLRSQGLGHTGAPFVTQVAQTMQVPRTYAEDIIGTAGANIAFIRRNSGAAITVEESMAYPEEITVEIKGTASEVQVAQQLIQEFINNHKEQFSNSYDNVDAGYRSMYGQLSNNNNYPPPSLPSQPYGSYGGSGAGGHSSFRL